MHPSRFLLRCLTLALLVLGSSIPGRAHAQSCTTRTECVDNNFDPLKLGRPTIGFRALGDTVHQQKQVVEVYFGDDWGLDEPSMAVTLSPGSFMAGGGWKWNKAYTGAWLTRTAVLAPGRNVLRASVCDKSGTCAADSLVTHYKVPPPPPGQAAATLRNLYNADRRNLATCAGCAEGVLQYTTPAYVSMDQPRSTTLFYSTSQAAPRGFVEIEALEVSPSPAEYMTLELRNAAGGLVTLDNGTTRQYYTTQAGPNVLAASFDAGGLVTGMYTYTAEVRSWWSGGTSSLAAQITVRVPVVNEGGSYNGPGWTFAGAGRVHLQADGALVTDGAGGVAWFRLTGCPAAGSCTYASPPGEPSTLAMVGGAYHREWPDGRVAQYSGTGRMATLRDRFGNQTTLQYDAGGTKLASVTDPAGMVTTVTYHPGGYLRSIVDPAGRESFVWYAGINLWQIIGPDGRPALDAVAYANNRVTGYTDARGGRWNVTYDGAARVQRIEAPAVTDGGVTARATTTFRSRESAVLPLPGTGTAGGRARRVTADSAALVIAANGDTTRVWTDAFGLAIRVRAPADTSTIRRDGNGLVRSIDDGRGNVVSFDYQSVRPYAVTRMQTVAPDGGGSWTYTYGAYGALKRVVEADGPVTDHVLNALGQRVATLRGADTVAWYGYDASGRVLTSTDAHRHTTTYTYQPSGTRNLATATTDGVITEHRYDALGRTVRTLAAGTAGDSVAYDALNRVTSVTAPAGITRFGFGVNGVDLDDVVDPLNQRYQFRHNAVGWVTQEIDPGGRIDAYGYNPATGTLRTATNRRGNAVDFTWDVEGRPLTRTADGATTTWRYDPDGRWAVAVNAASYDSISYDSEGKVTSTVTRRGALSFTVQRTYDDANRPDTVQVTGAWGSTMSAYLYDAFGRLEALRDPAGGWTKLFHNQSGMLDSLRLPTSGAARSIFSYTPRHELGSVVSQTTNQSRRYAYSPLGLVLRDSVNSGTVGWEHQYGYDGMQRLQSWELYKFGRKRVCVNIRDCTMVDTDSLAQSLAFSWDAVGNPAGATRDAGNRVRAHGGYSFDYDADGNLTRKYNASGFNQTFTWNALGQLTGTTRTGVGSATYQYDGLGRRIQRQDHTGAVTHYVYDGDDLVLEVDGAGNRMREYTYFPGIDAPHSMRQWANGAGGAIFYYQMHRPGHVSGLVNTSNQLVNEYRYTPFGMPVNGYPVQGTPNPLQYMARELDALSGLYYVRNRWYDPQQGRFVSEDPIGLVGGMNQYAYAGGNPVMSRDPSGLRTCWYYVTTWDAPVYDTNGRFRGYDTYETWELMYCESEETKKYTQRRISRCPSLDAYVCDRFEQGVEALRQHPSEICNALAAAAEQRMLTGGWLYNSRLQYNGWFRPDLNVAELGPAAMYGGETAATIAEEGAHARGPEWSGHRYNGTFVGPGDLAPDEIGQLCKSIPATYHYVSSRTEVR